MKLTLHVEAAVRYWEDATVGGVEDKDGLLIPFRDGDLWKPKVDLETGLILGWPQGVEAAIHYKVCDMGEYWIANGEGQRIFKYKGDYVPSEILCVGDNGYGDYIIFSVNGEGQIVDWKSPDLVSDDWLDIKTVSVI